MVVWKLRRNGSAALWDPPRTQLINSMPSPRISNVTINTSQNFQMLHPSRAGNAITDTNRGLHIADEICKKREKEKKEEVEEKEEEEKKKEEEDVLDASCVPLAKFSHPIHSCISALLIKWNTSCMKVFSHSQILL